MRRKAQAFQRWCMDAALTPRLNIPWRSTENPAPISQHRRLTLIRRVLADDTIPAIDRIVALLVLLYAQPVSRVARLAVDDVTRDGDQVFVRLGHPPSPVPEPFAGLLLDYIDARPNLTTATNRKSSLLFPGRRAGHPMQPESLQRRLRAAGIPTVNGRTAAIRQLVLQAPAPVVAGMLGYHDQTAAKLAADAGSPWSNYATGDHTAVTDGATGDVAPLAADNHGLSTDSPTAPLEGVGG